MQEDIQEEIEIDVMELVHACLKHMFSIIITTLLAGVIALLISRYMIAPTYTSTSKMLVLTKETTLASLADIQMGSQLTNDYQILIKSRPVLEKVIYNLELQMNYRVLEDMVTVNNPNNTRIIEISIDDSDPERAMDIVNELTKISSEFIGDKMEVVPPKIIEEGIIPKERTSPNHKKNLLIGMALGLLASCGFWCLLAVMDDSIKHEEDVLKYLEIPALACVPDRRDYINQKSEKRNFKKKKSIIPEGILKRFKKDK